MSRCLQLLFMLALGLLAGSALAQSDPPGRVARLNHSEGRVMAWPAGASAWTEAQPNRPLLRGDKLWAENGTRAEIQVGSTIVRMDGDTRLEVLAVGDDTVQLALTQGSVQARVRSLPEGENFEIDTPNLAYRSAYPGEVRIDVEGGSTRVTMRSGAGAVYGQSGQALPLGGGQQVMLRERSLALVAAQESPPQDNFDRWAGERDRRDEQSLAARYVPRELVGYQSLDANGQWGQDPAFGAVWFPSAAPTDWAPYRHGHWDWIPPWGWTWVDEAPWAFATSHYGRWAIVGARWAWVPGRLPLRPAYAPALVGFVGGPGATPLAIGGRAGVAWFPLAPGEPWQPDRRVVTTQYFANVNTNVRPLPATGHAYQRKPEAVTAMATDDFAHGKPVRAGRLSLGAPLLAQLQVTPAPAMPSHLADEAQEQARLAQARQQEQQQSARQQALAAEQAKAQQAKAQQAKAAQSAPQARKTRGAESSRAAQQAKQRQASRAAAAGSETGAKREAKTAPAQREQQARRAQQPRRTASTAKRPADRSDHAQQVEAARQAADREAQQLRSRREETARRRAAEQERARREALQRQQQALSD